MNPIYSLQNKDLLQFFRRHKIEMACMERPRIFLTQLRDHNLVPEDRYQKMSRMRSNLKNALYDFLEWLEKERPELIDVFWKAVFKEVIMEHYPTLRRLHGSLMEATPLKKGEEGDIWMWPLYKVQLPVTCGEQEGLLDKKRMAKGEKCILHHKRWFTPTQFEKLAGKESCKKWKETIRCMNTPLGRLIQEGHLKLARSRERTRKARKSMFAASVVVTDDEDQTGSEESDPDAQPSANRKRRSSWSTEEELDEQAEQEPEVLHDVSNTVFKVSCGAKFGDLHQKRFASGTCGKCIRTETRWMTPEEFVEEALGQTDTAWRRDIQWEGKPINELILAKVLLIHSLLCNCVQCKPNADEQENQRNDDECWVCKSDGEDPTVTSDDCPRSLGEDLLVQCDECPRSFHQQCHIPHIEDAVRKQESQWLCTFCVYKTNQEWFHRREQIREEAMSCNVSEHMLECQYLLLHLCACSDEHMVAPDSSSSSENESSSAVYKEIRMRLSVIVDKLQGLFYITVGEFVSNLQLVLATCTSRNQDAALIAVGNRLKKMFDEDFKNLFNIV